MTAVAQTRLRHGIHDPEGEKVTFRTWRPGQEVQKDFFEPEEWDRLKEVGAIKQGSATVDGGPSVRIGKPINKDMSNDVAVPSRVLTGGEAL